MKLNIYKLKKVYFKNIDVISDEDIKTQILSKSVFAVCKSGTASLQVCNQNVPSIIIYKLSFINFVDISDLDFPFFLQPHSTPSSKHLNTF